MNTAFSGVVSNSEELFVNEESVMIENDGSACEVASWDMDAAVTIAYAFTSAFFFSGILWAYTNRSTIATAFPFAVWALAFVVLPIGRFVYRKVCSYVSRQQGYQNS